MIIYGNHLEKRPMGEKETHSLLDFIE